MPSRQESEAINLKVAGVLEFTAATVLGALYLMHWRPVSAFGAAVVVFCVLLSSRVFWPARYRDKHWHAPLLRCVGFGLLVVASLLRGRTGAPFSIGFGILFLSSAL